MLKILPNKELTGFLDNVCTESHLRVETDLGDGFVRLRTDEAERRQAVQDIQSVEDAVLELLRNSRDAGACNIYLALSKIGNIRRIVLIDDGCGIPKGLLETIFEPRVTSKLNSVHMDKWGIHGRGMALYSINVNSINAKVTRSIIQGGSAFLVEFDTQKLSEKKDQSTFPSFTLKENNKVVINGPHNILRVCVEFALEYRNVLNVYIGSPSEIVATMLNNSNLKISASERTFGNVSDEVPLVKRFIYCATPECLEQESRVVGLDISERTSRRILDGKICKVDSLTEMAKSLINCSSSVSMSDKKVPNTAPRPSKDKSLHSRISKEDLKMISDGALKCFQEIADSYYCSSDIDTDTAIRDGNIVIKIPIIPSENF